MKTSQIQKFGLPAVVASIASLTMAAMLSGCETKVTAVEPPRLPALAPEISACADLSGTYFVNGLTYTVDQFHCDQARITVDCSLPTEVCEQLGASTHEEFLLTTDDQEREAVSRDPLVSKLYERATYDGPALVVSQRLVMTDGSSRTLAKRYIRKANPCGSSQPEAMSDVFGVETSDGLVTQCASGQARSFLLVK